VFRAPRVLRTGAIDGRACAVIELMPGRHADSFDALSYAQAESFGRALARAHQRTFDRCGTPAGRLTYPLAEFHVRAAAVIEWLAAQYRDDEPRDVELAAEKSAQLRALPPPETSALILYDIGAGQYLWDDDGPVAVVDTECYVYAPRELELICLEADNGRAFCEPFRRGYETVAPLPDLAPYRDGYRVLHALTETNGDLSLEGALTAPASF
jgi:aminoglycoside phosphotransferase (APT) family kinase protein